MHDGDGIPQYYLAPYYLVASGDGDVDVVSASPYSLTVGVDLTRQGPSGMRLTALASGGSGRYAYNWGMYTMAGIEAGVRTIGPGSAVTVGNGDGRATASAITLRWSMVNCATNLQAEAGRRGMEMRCCSGRRSVTSRLIWKRR